MNIARVFPRKTKGTPDDPLVFFGYPRAKLVPEVDEIHVSVSFTGDKPYAESLANAWYKTGIPVKIGGPAYDQVTDTFVPGLYLHKGYVITSVGCNNSCWFCKVHKRAGKLRPLPITEGNIVQDDNFLLNSKDHIISVFDMLSKQPERAVFSGGLESKLLKPWHVELMQKVKTAQMFFAYDTVDDYEPLIIAGKLLQEAGYTLRKRKTFCYVLMGYPGDTFEKAEKRCKDTLKAGFIPFAMLHMDDNGFQDPTWAAFQRSWCRVAAIVSSNKEFFTAV